MTQTTRTSNIRTDTRAEQTDVLAGTRGAEGDRAVLLRELSDGTALGLLLPVMERAAGYTALTTSIVEEQVDTVVEEAVNARSSNFDAATAAAVANQQAAQNLLNDANALLLTSEDILGDTNTARTLSQQARDEAQAARDAAQGARDAAQASASSASGDASAAALFATTAQSSAADAGQSASSAETQRVQAETARSGAEAAETSAAASVTTAEEVSASATEQAGISTTAANAAGQSATAAATSESNAASSATDAEQSAAVAQADRVAAETARSGAEVAEASAASSATDAEGSASQAATAQTVTASLTRDLLPSDFEQDSLFWTNDLLGDPAARGDLLSEWSFLDVAGQGRVARVNFNNFSGRNSRLAPKGYIRPVQGRTYRVTILARHVGSLTGSDIVIRPEFRKLDGSFGFIDLIGVDRPSFAAADVFEKFTFEYVMSGADAAYLFPFIFFFPSDSNVSVDIARFLIEDVTDSIAAGQSAFAAAGSASSAQFSANDALTSAQSAQGSATQAATGAGNASTSASQAAQSATDAAQNANTAATQATAATNSRNEAAGFSTSAGSSATNAAQSATTASGAASTAVAAQETAVQVASQGQSLLADQYFENVTPRNSRVTFSSPGVYPIGRKATMVSGFAVGSEARIFYDSINPSHWSGPLAVRAVRAEVDLTYISGSAFNGNGFWVRWIMADGAVHEDRIPLSDCEGPSSLVANQRAIYSALLIAPDAVGNLSNVSAMQVFFVVGWDGFPGAVHEGVRTFEVNRISFAAATITDASTEILQTSVATLEGNAAATFALRANAGGASGEIEIVAADDPINGPASAVAISAEYIRLKGTTLADVFQADELSALVANIGLFKSAPSGERIEIEDSAIRVYNAAGDIVVKIGDLS